MMTKLNQNKRAGESGNVLFLILIAVALFAALSYAVTQSTRSGSGDASGETNLINSAQLAQYPAGVRTSIVRMIIGGVGVDQIAFDAPSGFGTDTSDLRYNVFHPTGGGAVFQKAPKDVLADSSAATSPSGTWIFTGNYQIDGIGSTFHTDDSPGNVGNDIIAFLPGVTQNVCKKLNDELGIKATTDDGIPENPAGMATTAAIVDMGDMMTETGANSTTQGLGTGGAASVISSAELIGQPFGCFRVGAANAAPASKAYIYYHVLVER